MKYYRVPSFLGRSRSGGLPAGNAGAIADRAYDNGFVRIASPTAATGETWYWGYNSNDQVQNGTVNFSSTTSSASVKESTPLDTISSSQDEDEESLGAYISLDYPITINDDLRIGPKVSLMFASLDASNRYTTGPL